MSNRTITGACLRFSGIFFICAILVISSLVMCTFPISEGASVSKFVGNKEGYNLTFNTMGIDATPVFSVENKVPLTGASMKISTSDKGDGNYPLIPTVDVGVDNDIEWKYGGNGYGQFGRQTTFTTNYTSATSQFTSAGGTATTASMKMPKTATVTSASMDVRGRLVSTGVTRYDVASAGLRYPYESHSGNIDNTNGPDVAAVSYDWSNGKVLWFKCPSPATGAWTSNTLDSAVMAPYDIRIGDIEDKTGGGDIVVASYYYYGAIYWYHNVNDNGNTWTKYTIASNLYYPTTVRIADIDQDGDNDIVVLCYYYYSYFSASNPMVMWYENDGTPTSGSWPMHPIFVPRTYNDGYAWAMDVGNFNGDAYPDVAWVGQWNYYFRWAKNPTSGYSNEWAYYAVNSSSNYVYYPTKIFAANIDGSGYDDLATTCSYSSGTYWYQNPGTTSTWSRYTIDSGTLYGYDLFVGQFDGSNGVDVVTVHGGGGSYDQINLYKTATPTSTWTKSSISTTYSSPYTCWGDNFDAANGLDIFVASYNSGGAHWLANNGAASSWTWTEINSPSMTDPTGIEYGDFDKDGDKDLVVCGRGSGDIRWLENDGTPSVGSWTARVVDSGASGASNCKVVDMDFDGDADVVATLYNSNTVAWYINNGAGVFTKKTITTGLTYAFGLAVGDIDKDGHLDVAAGNNYWSSAGVYWYESPDNPATGTWTAHTIATGLTYVSNLDMGDIDKDGDLDVAMITYTWSGGVLNWYECPASPATATSWNAVTVVSGIQYGYDLQLVDINWDGYLDIVYTIQYYDVCWVKNPVTNPKNGGSWQKYTIVSFSGPWHYPRGLCVADIGQDGYWDVVFTTYYSNNVFWYEEPDDPLTEQWVQHPIDTTLNYGEQVCVADLDKDGVEDIAATAVGLDESKWYKISTQYCKDPRIDIGGDSVNEWQITGDCKGVYHFEFTTAMNTILASATGTPDDFGNNMVTSPIKLTVGAAAGKISIFNMSVIYDYTATIDKNPHCTTLKNEIQDILDHDPSNAASVKIHIAVESMSPGKVYLHDLDLTYNSHPDQDKSVPTVAINEDSDNMAVLDLADYFSDDYDAASDLNYEILMSSADASKVQLTLDGTEVNAKTLVKDWNGYVEASLKVTDNGDGAGCPSTLVYSNTFLIQVMPVNDEPTLGPVQIPSVTLNEGSTYTSSISLDTASYFLDTESNPLFFEAKVDPDGKYTGEDITAKIDSGKHLVITSSGNFVGKDVPVRVFCDDDDSLEYDQNPYQDIKVTVLNLPDDPPYWDPIPEFEVPEDCEQFPTVDLKDYVHDIDTNISKIEFTIVSNLNSTFLMASIGSDDIIYVTSADPNFDGRTTLIIRAYDGDNKGDTTMDIAILPENDVPTVRIINPAGNPKFKTGDMVGVLGSAGDPEDLKSVEVSIQKTGAPTEWKTAYGGLSWKYDWTAEAVTEATEYTVLARSFDGELYSEISSATFYVLPLEGSELDTDRDGYPDAEDTFPENPTEWKDTDKDKFGDNSDAFPNDPKESKDTDRDGIGDNSDPYPFGEDGNKGNNTGTDDSDDKGGISLLNLWWVVVILVLLEVVLVVILIVRKYQSKHPKSKSKAMKKKKEAEKNSAP